MKKILVLTVASFVWLIAYVVVFGNPTASVLHQGLTYTVTDVTNDSILCTSDPFPFWPRGQVVAKARVDRQQFNKLVEKGVKFRVSRESVGNYTPDPNRYIQFIAVN